MPTELKMPALSPTMEEGTLARWLVKEGDKVRSGDILAEIETDKATMEFEAVDEGVIDKLLVPQGSEGVKVGTSIALMSGEDEEAGEGVEPAAQAPSPRRGEGGGEGAPAPVPPAPALAAAEGEGASKPAADSGTARLLPARQLAGGATISVREALRDAMAEEMRRDPRVFVMGEEVGEYQGAYKVTQGLLEEFGPGRVIDTPITEHGFAGLGAGAAMGGLRPVIEFMTMNFAMQAIDQIINSAAKTRYMSGGQMSTPVVFRGPNGAAARVAAQHSQNFAPWYASVPGLIVIAPYGAEDAKGLLKSAIRCDDPVVFLENELLYGQSFELSAPGGGGGGGGGGELLVPIGQARIARAGRDVTLVSYSIGVGVALDAARQLAAEGIEAEVLDLRTLRPMDQPAILASLARTNRMVVVEEGWPACSIASEVIAVAMEQGFDDLDAPVLRVTNADVPMPYAANLEKLALVNAGRVVEAARAVCYR